MCEAEKKPQQQQVTGEWEHWKRKNIQPKHKRLNCVRHIIVYSIFSKWMINFDSDLSTTPEIKRLHFHYVFFVCIRLMLIFSPNVAAIYFGLLHFIDFIWCHYGLWNSVLRCLNANEFTAWNIVVEKKTTSNYSNFLCSFLWKRRNSRSNSEAYLNMLIFFKYRRIREIFLSVHSQNIYSYLNVYAFCSIITEWTLTTNVFHFPE